MKRTVLLKSIIQFCMLIIWEMFTRFGKISPFVLPDPISIFDAFIAQLQSGDGRPTRRIV